MSISISSNMSPHRIRQVYVWHKWTGLISGLFIFLVTLTGAVAMFKNEIDRWLTPAKAVTPLETRAPLEDVLKSMKETYPKSRVGQINLAGDAYGVHEISIKDGKVSRQVFINPYTAQITGTRSGETVANVIRQTHLRFYFFEWQGRVFVGVIGLALCISTLTGFLIYGPFMKHLAFGQIRWKRKIQLILSDWHKLVGIVTLLFNAVLGFTGAILGLENLARFSPPTSAILHPKPSPQTKKQVPSTLANRLTIDQAIQKAQLALPGFEANSVTMPRAKKNHWMLRGDIKGHFAAANTTWMMLDTRSGKPIEIHDARIAQPTTRFYNLSEPLHFGDFAGIPLKVLYCVFGLVSSSLYITGFAVWILKNRRKKPAALPHAAVPQTH